MSGDRDVTEKPDDLFEVRTKPCWICGQYTYLTIPYDAWKKFDLYDVPIDVAWPDGTFTEKRLIITGVHLKCWDAEYPDDNSEEKQDG